MILPDVNVLVYAFRREAPDHATYASWLARVVAGESELALHDLPLAGMVRIVTNTRIMPTPAPVEVALDFVAHLCAAPRARWLSSGDCVWSQVRELAEGDRGIVGNVVPDAHLAALALTHGCRLATADRGFARYPRLDWFDPAG